MVQIVFHLVLLKIQPPIKRPWYTHTGQDDNLLVLQGTRYVDIFNPKTKET